VGREDVYIDPFRVRGRGVTTEAYFRKGWVNVSPNKAY
jgi:hypothetical protein